MAGHGQLDQGRYARTLKRKAFLSGAAALPRFTHDIRPTPPRPQGAALRPLPGEPCRRPIDSGPSSRVPCLESRWTNRHHHSAGRFLVVGRPPPRDIARVSRPGARRRLKRAPTEGVLAAVEKVGPRRTGGGPAGGKPSRKTPPKTARPGHDRCHDRAACLCEEGEPPAHHEDHFAAARSAFFFSSMISFWMFPGVGRYFENSIVNTP